MGKQMKNATKQRLIVSKRNHAGRTVRIGSVNFDESHRAVLSTEGSGPVVDALKTAWQEIQKLGKLTWTQSVPGEMNGKQVTKIMDVEAKPGDKHYIYAVLDTLERKYGFTVDLERQ
jgi:hypothetical protein